MSNRRFSPKLIIPLAMIFVGSFILFPMDIMETGSQLFRRGINILVFSVAAGLFLKGEVYNHLMVWAMTVVTICFSVLIRYMVFGGMMKYAPEYVGANAITYLILNSLLVLFVFSAVRGYSRSRRR